MNTFLGSLSGQRRTASVRSSPVIEREGKVPTQGNAIVAWIEFIQIPDEYPMKNDGESDDGEDLSERECPLVERTSEMHIDARSFVKEEITKEMKKRVEGMQTQQQLQRSSEKKTFPMENIDDDPENIERDESNGERRKHLTGENGEGDQLDLHEKQWKKKKDGRDAREENPAADGHFPKTCKDSRTDETRPAMTN